MTRLPFVTALSAGVLAAGSAASAVLERMTLEDLARSADLVVVGTVVSRTSHYDAPPRADRIVTDVVVRVDRPVRGEAGSEVVVTTPGGEVDGLGQIVTGAPVLRPGEQVVLFLRTVSAGPPATGVLPAVPRRVVVGLSQGLFVVVRAGDEASPRVRQRLSGAYVVGEGEGPQVEMDLDLEDLVRSVRTVEPGRPTPAAPAVRERR